VVAADRQTRGRCRDGIHPHDRVSARRRPGRLRSAEEWGRRAEPSRRGREW
jgi:hypothetical protein